MEFTTLNNGLKMPMEGFIIEKTENRLFGFIPVSSFDGRLHWCISSDGREL